jgi:hypothetical protein
METIDRQGHIHIKLSLKKKNLFREFQKKKCCILEAPDNPLLSHLPSSKSYNNGHIKSLNSKRIILYIYYANTTTSRWCWKGRASENFTPTLYSNNIGPGTCIIGGRESEINYVWERRILFVKRATRKRRIPSRAGYTPRLLEVWPLYVFLSLVLYQPNGSPAVFSSSVNGSFCFSVDRYTKIKEKRKIVPAF